MQRKNAAFTLVELIVVITILAILGTIAFISLQGYSATSRDSVRIADVGSMSTALEIFQVNSGKYPLPDNGGGFTYLGDPLWTQGNFGENVVKNLSRNFSKAPTDPLSDKEYIYSRAGNGNEFQILNLLEGDITLNTVSQTNAAESVRTPKVGGTYNGLYIKTKNYLVPLPSILTSLDFNEDDSSEISGTGILSQVITGGINIPKYGNTKSGTGGITGLQLSVANIVTSESTSTEKAAAMQKIQDAYSGSSLENEGIYEYILSVSGEENLADLLETVVLDNSTSVVGGGDTEAPLGGNFTINEGTTISSTTSNETINLTVTCPSEDGVEMIVYGTGVQIGISYTPCTGTGQVTLTSLDGIKEVAMKFKDIEGNESEEIVNNITIEYILISTDDGPWTTFADVWNSKSNGDTFILKTSSIWWELIKIRNADRNRNTGGTYYSRLYTQGRYSTNNGLSWSGYYTLGGGQSTQHIVSNTTTHGWGIYDYGWGCGSQTYTALSNGKLCNGSSQISEKWIME